MKGYSHTSSCGAQNVGSGGEGRGGGEGKGCLNLFSIYPVVNQFIIKLDNRYEKTKKPGTGSTVKRERLPGLPSTSSPPTSLPSWMIDPSYKLVPATSMATVCVTDSLEAAQESEGGECVCVMCVLAIFNIPPPPFLFPFPLSPSLSHSPPPSLLPPSLLPPPLPSLQRMSPLTPL